MPREAIIFEPLHPVTTYQFPFAAELDEVLKVSKEVFLFVTAEELARPSLGQMILQKGLRGVCLNLDLAKIEAPGASLQSQRYQRAEERSRAAQAYATCRQKSPDYEIGAQIRLNEDTLPLIGSLLLSLAEQECPWVFLDMRSFSRGERLNAASTLKNAFSLLRIRGQTRMNIHFHEQCDPTFWNAATSNAFNGPLRVDIDVANTCTHNCHFCGLYGPSFVQETKQKHEGRLPEIFVKHMALKIDKDVCLNLLESLPLVTRMVQFGGEGDPLTHPHALEFIEAARRRGLEVEILSNFAYLDEAKIQRLHAVSGDRGLRFIINLSAATGETYQAVRPNQKPAAFDKVIAAIRKAEELRAQSTRQGMRLTLMSVINRWNFHEMEAFVHLGHELGVSDVWLKPLEVHSHQHRQMLPLPEQRLAFKSELNRALETSRKLKVRLVDENVMYQLLESMPMGRENEALL